eukprot:1157208-Pelagomonas_calceolata.AAC.2
MARQTIGMFSWGFNSKDKRQGLVTKGKTRSSDAKQGKGTEIKAQKSRYMGQGFNVTHLGLREKKAGKMPDQPYQKQHQ